MMAPSVAVYALGMGEIEVHSALNEPLNAQIKLLSATASELNALQVSLASNDAFSRMGIERTAALRDLRFEVVTQGAGAPFIRVISTTPMREPFLDLILMANWSNGQLMREYTLLLDPPVFDKGAAVAPVMAAKTESAAIDRGQKKPATVTASAPAPWVAPAGSYGPTNRTDTLWTVARQMRPNDSVAVPQMMIALLKENPEAFADGNVNNLKEGYILRTPSMSVINSISSSQAAAETNRQYQEWQAAAGKARAAAGNRHQQQLVSSAPASSDAAAAKMAAAPVAPAAAVESGARLKLLSPENAKRQGGAGLPVQGKGTATEQLAMALETAEATKQENAELKTRLNDLERQLQAVQRLLTLKGDTLGALQAGLAGKGKEAEPAGQQPDVAAPVASGASTAGQTAAQTAAVARSAPAAAAVVAKPEPKVAPAPVAETSLINKIMADPVLMAAVAGGPLLLLLVVLLMRRRRQQTELEEINRFPGVPASMAEESAPKVVMNGAGAGTISKSVDEENFGEMSDEEINTGFVASSGMEAIQAEEGEIDPIAEADVYLAYRRYEQAEALLKEAIRHDSARNELKLKLLEIYFTTKDKDAFEAQAEALYASLAGNNEEELWAQAVEMGREIAPEHPLFSEAGNAPSSPNPAVATPAAAAALAGFSGKSLDEFSFEKEGSDLVDELSFDLSDEELASSLIMPSLDDAKIGGGVAAGVLEDLPSFDEADFALGEGLDELPVADEFSLDDDLIASDELLSLDDDTSAAVEGEEAVLDSMDTLDAGETPVNSGFSLDDGLIGGGTDLHDFDNELDLDELSDQGAVKNGSESDSWTIAPAVSTFDSRDLKSEMDDGYVPITNIGKAVAGNQNLDHLSLDDGEFDLGDEPESTIFEGADDIVGTKLDLARAYIDMGDQKGARSILDEVVKEGDDSRRQEAEQLMRQIS